MFFSFLIKINNINKSIYYFAVLIKGIISIGFLNIVLMFYLKGRDLNSCVLYTVMGAFVVSSFNSIFYVILENYISVNSGTLGYLLPSGIYDYFSFSIENLVFKTQFDSTKLITIIVLLSAVLITLLLGVLVGKRAMEIEIEDIGRREYKSAYLYPILISSLMFTYGLNSISNVDILKLVLSLLVLVVSFVLIYLFNNKLKFKVNEIVFIVIILVIDILMIIYLW